MHEHMVAAIHDRDVGVFDSLGVRIVALEHHPSRGEIERFGVVRLQQRYDPPSSRAVEVADVETEPAIVATEERTALDGLRLKLVVGCGPDDRESHAVSALGDMALPAPALSDWFSETVVEEEPPRIGVVDRTRGARPVTDALPGRLDDRGALRWIEEDG